jgi:hypothetical protein
MLKGAYWEHRADLPVFMAQVMHEAILDLNRLNPAKLDLDAVTARFIGWAARRGPAIPDPLGGTAAT